MDTKYEWIIWIGQCPYWSMTHTCQWGPWSGGPLKNVQELLRAFSPLPPKLYSQRTLLSELWCTAIRFKFWNFIQIWSYLVWLWETLINKNINSDENRQHMTQKYSDNWSTARNIHIMRSAHTNTDIQMKTVHTVSSTQKHVLMRTVCIVLVWAPSIIYPHRITISLLNSTSPNLGFIFDICT